MHTAVIALKLCSSLPEMDASYIGADRGALYFAQKGIRMILSIGDFDSVNDEEFSLIQKYSDEVIRLNPIKDDSDSEAAIQAASERGFDRIVLTGATGGRMDHSLVNLRLALKYPRKIVLYDDSNLIEAYPEGTYRVQKGIYPFISFFTVHGAEITLKGFKYPLVKRKLTAEDLYTVSNEIIGEEGTVIIKDGTVLAMQCRDRK